MESESKYFTSSTSSAAGAPSRRHQQPPSHRTPLPRAREGGFFSPQQQTQRCSGKRTQEAIHSASQNKSPKSNLVICTEEICHHLYTRRAASCKGDYLQRL